MRGNYNATIRACFGGYMVQAVINTFVPLLFLTLRREYGLSLEEISLLITVNFLVQLTVDLLAARFVDRIGYRVSVVAAHLFSAAGLVLLTVLPQWMPPLAGLLIAVAVYAVGGGLIEVLISPIVEACPTRHKESVMSLLHSFYCWGCVATILLSTLFFALLGTGPWRVLACLWALLPLVNGAIFTQVPLVSLTPEDGSGLSLRQLARQPAFWVLLLLMACAGASEHGVSQWASALAESALGVSKTVGDLAPAALHDPVRRPVRGGLPAYSSVPLARPVSGRVRPVRSGGGLHVAGHLQSGRGPVPGGRHRPVCPAGSGGRPGLFRGTHGGGRGVLRSGRLAAAGHSAGGRLSAAAHGGTAAVETLGEEKSLGF